MARILIADSADTFCKAVARQIPEEHEALICTHGSELAEALQTLRPDLLIVDLGLNDTDVISLLQAAQMAGICPKIFALAYYFTGYMQQKLQTLNVAYAMVKPCIISQVAAHAVSICSMDEVENEPDVESQAEIALTNLGFFRNLNGYNCVVCALCALIVNPNMTLTKELYPYVASQCGGNWKSVEHAIRNCVEKAYKHRCDWVWKMYFPAGRDGTVGHLTNAAFLTCLAAHLRKYIVQRKHNRKVK